ncbi:hypothetical protein BDQ17DRAFT_1331758 [Cyathus striatus]|nr:hypothetical protein BDQ17DRAFT_1336456 [Cyathus striatus]KAF8993387.1 hypothetical protein BDQ17DRAFT_1331758 [Cyathus striatus]
MKFGFYVLDFLFLSLSFGLASARPFESETVTYPSDTSIAGSRYPEALPLKDHFYQKRARNQVAKMYPTTPALHILKLKLQDAETYLRECHASVKFHQYAKDIYQGAPNVDNWNADVERQVMHAAGGIGRHSPRRLHS